MGAISRVFKSATKAVKKVTRGVTKAAKRIGKGIAKIGKNVWNGIKDLGGKAFELYGKISGKLGPIGMIGLSMAMPYLMPGFTSSAGGLWTKFGAKMGVKGGLTGWANASTNPFLKTIGTVGQKIYTGTNFIKGTAQGISQTIGATFKGFAGEGGSIAKGFSNLYKGTAEVLTGQAGKGTMWSQSVASVTMPGWSPGMEAAMGKSVMMPMINPNTITQTGGIALGNLNVANKFVYEATSKAMTNAGVFEGWKGDTSKYLNTLREAGLDDRTAYEYLRKNGVDGIGGLDKSLSADFKWAGHPVSGGYEFTGDNLRNTFDAANHNFAMKITKPTVEGDVFMRNDSLLNSKTGHSKSNKLKDAALDYALTNGQNNDVAGLEIANSIQAAEANKTNAAWTGTSMSYAGGTLLNEAQRKYFANLNMDIKPV